MTAIDKYKRQISKPYFSLKENCTFRIVMNESIIIETKDNVTTQNSESDVIQIFNAQKVKSKNKSITTSLQTSASAASVQTSDAIKVQTWLNQLGKTTEAADFAYLSIDEIRPTLTNINQIVSDYARRYNYTFGEGTTFESDPPCKFYVKTKKIKQDATNPLNDISKIGGVQCDPTQFKSIETIGDGTCLIHSILLSISDAYRKCNNKGPVGWYIRSMLKMPGQPGTDLEDSEIEKIAKLFNIGILYFQAIKYHTYSCGEIHDTSKQCIIIVNVDYGHYMAVTYKNEFMVNNIQIECEFEQKVF